MLPCQRCHRHLRPDATSCPFCTAKRERAVTAAILIAAAVGTTACYGGPSRHDRMYTPPDPSASADSPAPSK